MYDGLLNVVIPHDDVVCILGCGKCCISSQTLNFLESIMWVAKIYYNSGKCLYLLPVSHYNRSFKHPANILFFSLQY